MRAVAEHACWPGTLEAAHPTQVLTSFPNESREAQRRAVLTELVREVHPPSIRSTSFMLLTFLKAEPCLLCVPLSA